MAELVKIKDRLAKLTETVRHKSEWGIEPADACLLPCIVREFQVRVNCERLKHGTGEQVSRRL